MLECNVCRLAGVEDPYAVGNDHIGVTLMQRHFKDVHNLSGVNLRDSAVGVR